MTEQMSRTKVKTQNNKKIKKNPHWKACKARRGKGILENQIRIFS